MKMPASTEGAGRAVRSVLAAQPKFVHASGNTAPPLILLLLGGVAVGFLANGFTLSVANTAVYYVMLVLGLNLVIGMTGQLDFGHLAFFAIGSYVAAKLLVANQAMDFIVVMLIAMAAAAIASVLFGFPIFRFKGDYLALVSLAAAEIVHSLAINLSWTNGANGIAGVPPPQILGTVLTDPRSLYWLGLVLVGLMALGLLVFSWLRPGRALLAIREDELAARAAGIRPLRYKLLSFTIAGATAGIAGAYFAAQLGFVGPESFGVEQTIIVAEMVFLGGLGSIYGSILGATTYVAARAVLINYVPSLAGQVDLVISAAILAFIILRPQGIAGTPFVRRRA